KRTRFFKRTQSKMKKQPELDVCELLSTCGLTNTRVNIYQTGSRVYGTNQPDSDYDFFVVVTDEFFSQLDKLYNDQEKRVGRPFELQWTPASFDQNYHDGYRCLSVVDSNNREFNLNLYNTTSFRIKMTENWIQALQCIYLPAHFTLKQDLDEFDEKNIVVHYKHLVRNVVNEASKHFARFKKIWNSDRREAKKNLVHTFRGLIFGMQIVEHGSIIDYSAANDLYYMVRSDEEQDIEKVLSTYTPIYHRLRDDFNKFIFKERINPFKNSLTNDPAPLLLRYLEKFNYDINVLEKYLSLTVKFGRNNLVHIRDSNFSPHSSQIVLECANGTVVDLNSRSVASQPIKRVLELEHKNGENLNLKNTKMFLRRSPNLSCLVTLYYFNNEWLLSSEESADASDVLYPRVHSTVGNSTIAVEFWKLIGTKIDIDPNDQNKCFVFILDLCHHYFKNSCHHYYHNHVEEREFIDKYNYDPLQNNQLRLLAVINKDNHSEVECNPYAFKYNWCICELITLPKNVKLKWLQDYVRSIDPLEASSIWLMDDTLKRAYLPLPQRSSLIELLKLSEFTEQQVDVLITDVIRSVHLDEKKLNNLIQFFSNHERLVLFFNKSLEKYNKLVNAVNEIMSHVFSKDSKTMIQNLESLDISKWFNDGVNCKRPLQSLVMGARKEQTNISNIDEYLSKQPVPKFIYPVLFECVV
ncbi:hypothetical protein AKO1_005155, partial [Acrasis kona]